MFDAISSTMAEIDFTAISDNETADADPVTEQDVVDEFNKVVGLRNILDITTVYYCLF